MRTREFFKEKRQIRVFISSSFEDMDKERRHLTEVVFPRIQERARKRAVAVTALDLRWGIPKGTDIGKTIEICMNEIDNSFPFFIGIVGGHYGTQPDKSKVFDSNEILREQFSALSKYFEKKLSITEMEMRYGVLDCEDDEKKRINALFLTRKADLVAINKDVRLNTLNEDIHNCGERFDESLITRDAKNHIWTSDYSTIEEFGRIVEVVFEDILDRLFPEDKKMDIYQRQSYMQESIVADLSRFYVPNNEDINTINSFIDDPTKQLLLITGESGCGKSSLLAYWISTQAQEYSKKGVDCLYHFVGSGETEVDKTEIEQRILHEMFTVFSVKPSSDDENKSLELLFSRNNIRDSRSFIIIIDAVNQLETGLDLQWLRLTALPQDVKLIISTQQAHSTELIIRESYPDTAISVNGLTDDADRKKVIDKYVKQFHGRDLGDNINKVINWPLSKNPLALRTLLNELIVAGRYDKMDALVDRYITSRSINSLFCSILLRIIGDSNFSWVKEALGAIALSRYGLTEDEILKIISTHLLYWSSFFYSFQRHFFVRNGLISFSHQYVLRAVEHVCLKDENYIKQIHRSLIAIFFSDKSPRGSSELIFHFFKLEEYDKVFALLIQPKCFCDLWKNDNRLLISYWEKLISLGYSPEPLVLITKDELVGSDCDLPGQPYFTYCHYLQDLLHSLGQHELMSVVVSLLQDYMNNEAGTTQGDHLRMYRTIAIAYKEAGKFQKAIEYYNKSFFTWHKGCATTGFDDKEPDLDELNTFTYCSMASCYRQIGDIDNAEKFIEYAKQSFAEGIISLSSNKYIKPIYVDILLEQYNIYNVKGDFLKAQQLLQQCFELGGQFLTYQKLAEIFHSQKYYYEEFYYLNRHIKNLKGELSTKNGVELGKAYREVAKCMYCICKLDLAEKFIEASLTLFSDRKDAIYQKALSEDLKGLIDQKKGNYLESLHCFLSAADVYKTMSIWPKWVIACKHAALLSINLGQVDKSLELLSMVIKKKKAICTDYQLGELYWSLSSCYFHQSNYEDSFTYARMAFEKMFNKLGPRNTQSQRIIQRLDDSLQRKPSIGITFSVPDNNKNLSEWDKYTILFKHQNISYVLKSFLLYNNIVSTPSVWTIVLSLINHIEEKALIRILESNNTDELIDKVITCIERDYDKDFLMRVLLMVYFSPCGADESRIASLSRHFKRGTWESLIQIFGSIFTRVGEKVFFSSNALKDPIISHYFAYSENDSDNLKKFSDEMARVCPNILFTHINEKPYFKQIKQDSNALKRYITITSRLKAEVIKPDLTLEMIKIVSKYCSSHDDITMMLLIRYYKAILFTNGVDDNITQSVAKNLLHCTNFNSVPDSTRGNVFLVLGLKAYNDKEYDISLSYLARYCMVTNTNESFELKKRCYEVVRECLMRIQAFEVVLPKGFNKQWEWESNKYKILNSGLLKFFSVTDIIEDKENKQIIIKLDENTERTDKSIHKSRFVRYAFETQIAMKGKAHVVLCCRRGLWHDPEDNTEQMNLYPIKYSDGVKLKDFNTFIRTIYKEQVINSISDFIIE